MFLYLNCGHVHLQKDPLFQQFIILVSVEGLENKYNLELSRGTLVCVCPGSSFLFINVFVFYVFRVEGAKESKIFGFFEYAGHPD